MGEILAELVGGIVSAIAEAPILLVLIAAGIAAGMIGGIAGWATFIGISLAATAAVKRFFSRGRRKGIVAWVIVHIVSITICVAWFIGLERQTLGLVVGATWLVALIAIGWMVPARPPREPVGRDQTSD